ncbi:MAG: site-specific integrase [Steroidobacteraceae bacterium]|nr:site-specific integrase [Nevskiaceae bacterium]MCP5472280.1 site-specific integrase [Nevskiaceae bacterium]
MNETATTRRRLSSGMVELLGPTWWNRYREEVFDPETGEVRILHARMRLGSRTELRSRRAAEERLQEYLALLSPATLQPGADVLFVDYAARYLAVHVVLFRPTSRRKYRGVIHGQLIPAFAGKRLDQVDAAALQQLVAALAQKDRARATIKLTRDIALQLLRRASADGFAVHAIPTRHVKVPRTQHAERERRYIGTAELGDIVLGSPWPERALWACLGYAALRIGEGLGLCWDHVDFEGKFIRVRQACVNGQLAPLKTASSRGDVPMLDELGHILRAYREVWMPNPQGLLFATMRGTPLQADFVRRAWLKPRLQHLGLAPAGTHAFRHGAPSRLVELGLSPATVQKFMRHTSLAMTERYLHHSVMDAWNAIRAAEQRKAKQP